MCRWCWKIILLMVEDKLRPKHFFLKQSTELTHILLFMCVYCTHLCACVYSSVQFCDVQLLPTISVPHHKVLYNPFKPYPMPLPTSLNPRQPLVCSSRLLFLIFQVLCKWGHKICNFLSIIPLKSLKVIVISMVCLFFIAEWYSSV